MQFYDSNKRFPAWGFGARPIDGPVSHCFNLNGSSSYCEVECQNFLFIINWFLLLPISVYNELNKLIVMLSLYPRLKEFKEF